MNIIEIINSNPDRVRAIKDALELSPTRPDYGAFVKAAAILFSPVQAPELDALSFLLRMATLGMDPSPAAGHVTLVQRGGQWRLEEGYKFRLHLLHLAGFSTETHTVNEGEDCKVKVRGGMSVIEHDYPIGTRSPNILASYCITERTDGDGRVQRYVGMCDNNQLARLKSTKNGWASGPEAMAKKAAVHRLRHTMPIEALGLSIAAASALAELDAGDGEVTLPPSTPNVADSVSMAAFYEMYIITPEEIDEVEARYPDPAERRAFIENNFDRHPS